MSNKITKEFYLQKLEYVKIKQKELNDFKAKLREAYIESNKPCDIGDHVRFISFGGKEYVGEVVSFSLFDTEVFIDCVKSGNKKAYQTKPQKSIEVISKAVVIQENQQEVENVED
jgi:hypothetical protein